WFGTIPATSNSQSVDPCSGLTGGVVCDTGNVQNKPFPTDDITYPANSNRYILPAGTQQNGSLKIYGASTARFQTQTTASGSNLFCGTGATGSSGTYCVDTSSGVKKTIKLTFKASGTSAVLATG